MLTTALRLYGKNDLRLEKFELPNIKDDEILASVVTDSICFSTWKEVNQGADHKKVPNDIAENPIIVGHEFSGNILRVGSAWKHKFSDGSKYIIQANLQLPNLACPGYSFPYIGGEATHIIIPKEVLEKDCLLTYSGDTYFEASMIEPLSCIIGAFNANYHLIEGTYNHKMGIKEGGNLIILGGMGPMGMLAVDLALHGLIHPKRIVVTGRSNDKIAYCKKQYNSPEGIEIIYVNATEVGNQKEYLMNLVNGEGFDDVFVFVPNKDLVELASDILATDGCVNFFAGPQESDFKAPINFYDIHYAFTHYVGTSGGNTQDMREGIALIENKKIQVNKIITHVLGLDSAAHVTINQPTIPGGKKLVYSQKKLPMIDLRELVATPTTDEFLSKLRSILLTSDGLWTKEAEEYIFENAPDI